MHRSYKESHQGVDLVPMFEPVTKWAELVATPGAVPEMFRKAFKLAQTERPGAVYLAVPEDVEQAEVPVQPDPVAGQRATCGRAVAGSDPRAAAILLEARNPVVLAGHGAARANAGRRAAPLRRRAWHPVATTFHGKGVFPDDDARARRCRLHAPRLRQLRLRPR